MYAKGGVQLTDLCKGSVQLTALQKSGAQLTYVYKGTLWVTDFILQAFSGYKFLDARVLCNISADPLLQDPNIICFTYSCKGVVESSL